MLAESLIRALERKVITPGELDATTREGLQHLADAPLRARATSVLAKFAPPQRSAVIDRYQAALKLNADAKRGEAVFAKNCQTCHQHQGRGHRVGPDLSGIAGRGPDALLSDILDPNRNVEPDYVVLTAATRRGQVLSGLLAEETATTVKLRRAEGVEETLLRSEIEQLRSTGTIVDDRGTRAIAQPPGHGRPDRVPASRRVNHSRVGVDYWPECSASAMMMLLRSESESIGRAELQPSLSGHPSLSDR